MTFDELSARHDGAIPQEEKAMAFFGSRRAYHLYFLKQAEKNFAERCLHIVRATAAWRVVERYPVAIRATMLKKLQSILRQARAGAVACVGLSEDLSKVAVTAAPINTA